MKKITLNKIAFLLFVVTMLASCTKNKVEPSKPTYLPSLVLNGDKLIVILVGDTSYRELGAVAKENGTAINVAIDGEVDVNTPGVYILSYSATNSDGYSASLSRTVIVMPESFIPGSADISGDYKLASNSRPSTVTKVVDGVYTMSDGWGTATSSGNPSPIFCYLFCTDGVNITMPNYPTVFGGMEGTGTYDGTKMVITTTLVDQGPLTRVRTWNKQ